MYTYSVVYRCTSGIQPIKTWTASSRGCLKLIYPRLNINWRDISFLTWTGDNQERYNKYAVCLKTSVLNIVLSPLLAARRLNYEGRSPTGSVECICRQTVMNDPGAQQPSQMFLTWVKARPQHRELRALLLTNSVCVLAFKHVASLLRSRSGVTRAREGD